MTDFGYTAMFDEEMLLGLMSGLSSVIQIPSTLLNIAAYVLTALAIYTLAQRRGLKNPWLAWIPGFSCWLVGSLSDQYQYVVNGANKSKRKVLLVLYILEIVLVIVMIVLCVVMVVQGIASTSGTFSESELMEIILGPALGILGLCLPLIGISIAFTIIYYIALYDLYKSMDPSNCVLFLVLSIIFGVTAPFFLFFNRNKDLGMPPRRYAPSHIPQQTWEEDKRDYL